MSAKRAPMMVQITSVDTRLFSGMGITDPSGIRASLFISKIQLINGNKIYSFLSSPLPVTTFPLHSLIVG